MKSPIKSLFGLYVVIGIITSGHPALLALRSVFRSHGVRTELRQGRGLVGNLADLLVDSVALAALKCA